MVEMGDDGCCGKILGSRVALGERFASESVVKW